MKFKKEWKTISIILIAIFLVLIIYNFNKTSKKETFQNQTNNNVNIVNNSNNNSNSDINQYAELRSQIAAFADVSEDRIRDLKVEGVVPSVTVSYVIMPRTVDQMDDKSLEEVKNDLNDRTKDMGYNFTIDGETLRFIGMTVEGLDKPTETQYQKLMNKFIDRGLDDQIKHIKDIQNMVKYNNPMDRFYEFTKVGDLVLDSQQKNEIPVEGQEGSLDTDVPPIEQSNNAVNGTTETFIPRRRFH